ncbi:hypothetical protein X797_002998 [Metarhizium robertsii]|uniref:Uncharacterized protein n=2 Tax=Metarhizium robertsii TaxID=568076 RepID=E9ETE0_METRA|nr:uncharacterized protein MAA_03289 [Metarhizium robertsii ARSEF 23]EFZ00693.1 hypothetical protein MAA_03289 [Metarhizium robertsii ARSEF 23]EXV03201.1 hypothetical protein X797_002998 [Metarhizium robertsii]
MAAIQNEPLNFSLPLPHSLDTRIYVRLSTQAKAIVLSLTTATQDELAAPKPMGSFVYALPNRFDDKQPLSTTLFPSEPSVEFTTRLAKLLARRVQLPVYVTNSMSFANTGMGGAVEEEMEAFRNLVAVIVDKLKAAGAGALAVNGELPK